MGRAGWCVVGDIAFAGLATERTAPNVGRSLRPGRSGLRFRLMSAYAMVAQTRPPVGG